ncbi:hypothetical protein [Methanoplanus endosymbiosus]|uniref:Uncharacterized protein n=1 Tax=Methanoplanus endosymbiosus TaxID=33865 RepID=A0A9E7THX8_9EURY|nr:hypothetical protein [Methanoplanus endosymbiosus]UUX91468.1 hypothetical protein L6E24_08785 [Methanoplanus endosymbiosus]
MILPFGNSSGGDKAGSAPEMSLNDFHRKIEEADAEAKKIISKADDEIKSLDKIMWKLRFTTPILAAAVLINIWLVFFCTSDYFLYWIMSSFIFLMVNPFLMMLPTDVDEIKSYVAFVKDLSHREKKSRDEVEGAGSSEKKDFKLSDKKKKLKALTKQKKFFSEFAWNLFFINCQPLTLGFLLLFFLSSVFAFAGWMVLGTFERYSSLIVIIQSVAIIAFYAGIAYAQPYSRGFFSGMLGMHTGFKKRYESGWTQLLRYILYSAVIVIGGGLLFVAAILLPGFTFNTFTSAEADLQFKIGLFLIIFLSQIIFVRHLQGAYSRKLVSELLNSERELAEEEFLPTLERLRSESEGGAVTPEMAEELRVAGMNMLSLEMVSTDYRALFGYFPVCTIIPDMDVIKEIPDRLYEEK